MKKLDPEKANIQIGQRLYDPVRKLDGIVISIGYHPADPVGDAAFDMIWWPPHQELRLLPESVVRSGRIVVYDYVATRTEILAAHCKVDQAEAKRSAEMDRRLKEDPNFKGNL